ncbi:histidine phosphatase family protein [Anaerolineae bacterium CFX7]|nr:histidine phosphatase family protein [Anaerolineae bacterium CFX7]
MDLILIRHGQSQYNVDQTGGADAPLTAWGREQARRVGVYCQAQFHLDALYASTYCRARDTAEIINAQLELARVTLVDELREFDDDYGFQMPQFETPLRLLQTPARIVPADISPQYAAFQTRVQRGLEWILARHTDKFESDAQIGIVSHGGTMGTILRTITGNHAFSLDTENTGIHILRWQAQRWHILALNRTEHLECDRWRHENGKDA